MKPFWAAAILTPDFLLPLHLVVQVLCLLEEVIDLAALLISLGGVEHTALGLACEELADVGHGEDNLLHRPVVADNLQQGAHLPQDQLLPTAQSHPFLFPAPL